MKKKVTTEYICDICGVSSSALVKANFDGISPNFYSFSPSMPYFRDNYTEANWTQPGKVVDICHACGKRIADAVKRGEFKHPVQEAK